MLTPAFSSLVRALFTISSPNTGTELADWAFGPGRPLASTQNWNLLTPGVEALQTTNMATFRANADPILQSLGIPIYTLSGEYPLNDAIMAVTGVILRWLVPTQRNDGLVTVERSRLSPNFATDLGSIGTSHFKTDTGNADICADQRTLAGAGIYPRGIRPRRHQRLRRPPQQLDVVDGVVPGQVVRQGRAAKFSA